MRVILILLTLLSLDYKGDAEDDMSSVSPFLYSLYAALAYAISTLAVNSGLDSNFKEYSLPV